MIALDDPVAQHAGWTQAGVGLGEEARRMPLSAEQIAGHPLTHEIMRAQSEALLKAYSAKPRLSSVFATQQRWLMAHAALGLHFTADPNDERSGFSAARFFDVIRTYAVGSRNTADAFLKEMLNYGYIDYLPGGIDRRVRPMQPSQESVEALHGWMMAHLATLDALDNGGRFATYMGGGVTLAALEPHIAIGLLTSQPIREPQRTFSLFTWLNNGGVVMDWLISGIAPTAPDVERIPTSVLSIADMAAWLKLSRSHLTRKLREAEAMGSLGWVDKRGRSTMWVSRGFRNEYIMAQAQKLAVIDAAYEAAQSSAGFLSPFSDVRVLSIA